MNEEKKFSDNYLASDLQLWQLAQNILSRDIDYCTDLLLLFENQKLERLREDREAIERTKELIAEQELLRERKSDD